MHFDLVDRVVERSDDRIVTLKNVSSAEEYLQDHFPGFPVLPGVMMLECMVQAGRRLVDPLDQAPLPWVLGKVRALRYGRFVKPGDTLIINVTKRKGDAGEVDLQGEVRIRSGAPGGGEDPVAASGRFSLRPVRLAGIPSPAKA